MDGRNKPQANQTTGSPTAISQTEIKQYEIREPVGYALLLGCNTHPSQQRPSPSISQDLQMMEDTLKKIGWKVENPCLNSGAGAAVDLTVNSCEQIINNLETPEMSQFSCFMLYYSGHGVASGIIGSNGHVVTYRDIVTKIGCLNILAQKPKIFIFDCCRHTHQKDLDNMQNQFIKANLSYTKEIEDHLRHDQLTEGYPPSDCILCFSACEGSSGLMEKSRGSYFTMKLCSTLLQFGGELPFTEIMTQVNGGTLNMSLRLVGVVQQPVIHSTLNRQLILSPTGDRSVRNGRSPPVSLVSAVVEPGLVSGGPPSVSQIKGPYISGRLSDNHDVVPDAVTSVRPNRRRVFKTRADVEQNLTKLGEGVSVFIVYAPDPESPYHDPHTREQEMAMNEKRVFRLVYDLECLGFHAITDLHLGDDMPSNWLKWYTSRVELCNYVLLVGSPAFCELFSQQKPRGQILDRRARLLLSYRNAVYAEIAQEVSTNPGASKFVPILLDPRWPSEVAVPSLVRAATVYHLLEDEHRQFTYDNGVRDFEKLVCRMAGINRLEINKPQVIGVQPLPPPYQRGNVHPSPVPSTFVSRLRIGYKVIRPPMFPPSSTATGTTASTGVPTTVGSRGGLSVNPYPPQPITVAPPPNPSHPVQVGQPMYHPSAVMGGPPQPLLHYSQQMVTPSGMVHPASGYCTAQPPQPHPQPGVPSPDSLPDVNLESESDRTEMFMWLADSLVGWPFIARNLGFKEPTIERIKEENPRNISEQCYQMLNKWYRERPSELSCKKLGQALFDSERNRLLYPVFVQRVMALEQSQAMDTQ